VEGGVHGFRLMNNDGKIMRFISRGNVEYQPSEFNAYYGDLLAVTYYSKIKSGKEWHSALKVELLEANPSRIDLQKDSVTGIIRSTGMIRSMVYLPEHNITVPFYKKSPVSYSPQNWLPKEDNQVKIYYHEHNGRFVKKFKYYKMDRLNEGPVLIEDRVENGVLNEILSQRGIHKVPSAFNFRLKSGGTLTIYAGGETKLVPEEIKVQVGDNLKIKYYNKLMSDLSSRYVAVKIEEDKVSVPSGSKIEKDKVSVPSGPKVIVNPNEPWTGTWKVTGSSRGAFVLKLKQSGNTVKSIRGSDRLLSGKVKGNRLKGQYPTGTVYDGYVNFKMSDDFKSFQGAIDSYYLYKAKGERQE